jgi:hypothetical protein
MEVRWNDAFYPGQGKPDESPQAESVEVEFIGYEGFAEFEIRVRAAEDGTIYRMSEFCDREPVEIYTEKECHTCGQSRWVPYGRVDEVDIPGRPESEQETFADISKRLAEEDKELV